MFTKAKLFNLALGHLLLSRQIVNADTDQSNESKVLKTYYEIALNSSLEDMNLDGTSTQVILPLLAEFDPNAVPLVSQWLFAYQYPVNCAAFRRIQSCQVVDNKTSHIPKRVAIYNGQKAIFTNQQNAIAEFVPTDFPLSSLSASAGLAISFRLALLSTPLITGKGAARLIKDLQEKYVMAKIEAQQQDALENFSFEKDSTISEFVEARLS